MPIEDHPFYSNLMAITTTLISDIATAQDTYFSANGKYFQGVKTPSSQLDGTTEGTMDVDLKPPDQLESWVDFAPQTFKRNTKIPYQITVDTYESEDGHGYVIKGDRPAGIRVPSAIVRLLTEHNQKIEKIIKRSDVEGRVTVFNVGDLTKERSNDEVD